MIRSYVFSKLRDYELSKKCQLYPIHTPTHIFIPNHLKSPILGMVVLYWVPQNSQNNLAVRC
jgi:hypothetical protein